VAAPRPADRTPNRTRTPHFGGGAADEAQLRASLRTLELMVRRKLDGMLKGDHQGLLPGPGSEPGESRPYIPGDDVRLMDWPVTARTTHPHVRQMIADRELQTWLVVDMSASMDFSSGEVSKRDLAVAASAAIAHLVSGPGNRVGAVIANGQTLQRVPPGAGPLHRQRILHTIATAPVAPEGVPGDLRGALDRLRRPRQRRGLVVVISDFLGPFDYARELRGLGQEHEMLAVEVLDPRDLVLPVVGQVALRDAETGEVAEVTITEQVAAHYTAAANAHRRLVSGAFRAVGAPTMSLSTDRDWLSDVVRFVATRRQSLAGGA
jgi:uncharacterized protein (DUF58 family)